MIIDVEGVIKVVESIWKILKILEQEKILQFMILKLRFISTR